MISSELTRQVSTTRRKRFGARITNCFREVGEMSTTKPNDASLLARLDDALMDNIFELSEADLDAEIKELGLDPAAEVASMRSAIDKAVKAAAKATLLSAKAELA